MSRKERGGAADDLLTSQDLFGDLVDGPIPEGDQPEAPPVPDGIQPAPGGRGPARRSGLTDPGVARRLAAGPPEPASARRPAPATDPALGRPFGPYTLLKRVAAGGMAEVFKASQEGTLGFRKVLAVKRILPHLSRDQELVDLFIHEAKVVAPLTHPNIVQIFDLGRIEGSYYIAMEYVHGRDLRRIERRAAERGTRLPLPLAALVTCRICSALGYAHRKRDARGALMNIVHRDVSPQNILISFDGSVKLADFGIAKAASRSATTDREQLRGKLQYMSPEQAAGRVTDHRADIFCLGIVLYEMLTGTRPFRADSEATILQKIREGLVVPPREVDPEIPERLERVVLKALHPDPEQRYQDAVGMHRAVERACEPASELDLAGFLEEMFEPAERGVVEDPPPASDEFEIEFEAPPAARPADALSVETLLERFRRHSR